MGNLLGIDQDRTGGYPPILFAGMRYGIAFVCLALMLLFHKAGGKLRIISKREWGRLILLGLLYYAATQGAIFLALAHLPAVTVNLLWSFSTILVALFGAVWLAEKPTIMQWGGIFSLSQAQRCIFTLHPFPSVKHSGSPSPCWASWQMRCHPFLAGSLIARRGTTRWS